MPETITQALTRDHNAVMRDVAAVRSDIRLAPRLYPGIADAIRRHSAAEEATLYRAMRSLSPMDAKIVSALEAGHRQIAAALTALDVTPYGSPRFAGLFLTMSQLLAAHVRYEEGTVFPLAQRQIPLTRQYVLARRYMTKMGETRAKNASIARPARVGNCACKNPCSCASPRRNPKRRAQWYHHLTGIGAPLLDMLTAKRVQVNALPNRRPSSLTWPSPYKAPPHGSYGMVGVGHGPTYG